MRNGLTCLQSTLRGWCWRSRHVLQVSRGAVGAAAPPALSGLILLLRLCPSRDYLMAGSRGPLPYSCALAQLRPCLHVYTSLDQGVIMTYPLHSLKVTCLSWSLQLQVEVEQKAAQGHHRVRSVPGSARYSGEVPAGRRSSSSALPEFDLARGCWWLGPFNCFGTGSSHSSRTSPLKAGIRPWPRTRH